MTYSILAGASAVVILVLTLDFDDAVRIGGKSVHTCVLAPKS